MHLSSSSSSRSVAAASERARSHRVPGCAPPAVQAAHGLVRGSRAFVMSSVWRARWCGDEPGSECMHHPGLRDACDECGRLRCGVFMRVFPVALLVLRAGAPALGRMHAWTPACVHP